MSSLQLLFAAAVLLGFGLLGRLMAAHDSLPMGPSTDHVDSSLHKILRTQHRLEEKLERLSRSLEQLRQQNGPSLHDDVEHEGDSMESHVHTHHRHRTASDSEAASCSNQSPFHTLLTAQSSVYQQWQARIAYHHWKKQAAAGGKCTDMIAFHRLCATKGGEPDGLEKEIPTIFTVQLSDEVISSHFGFGVLNRPNSVKQLLTTPSMRSKLAAPFVLLLETDHVFMKPLPNLATKEMPAALDFGYMHAHASQNEVIRKYWPEGDASQLDPVGPSPCQIHVDQLEKLTDRWLDFSLGLRSNSDAERVMQGWVQEMWGYSIAAASVGIKHRVVKEFQTEASSLTAHVPADFSEHFYIFHYTYGIEYTLGGKPQGINQIGEWSLDKRHYGNDHPPRNLQPPPDGANAAAYWLLSAWNEASSAIADWPTSKSMGTLGWRRVKPTQQEVDASPLARAVAGTRWTWGGDERGITFHPSGELTTPWDPKGTWGIIKAASEGAEDGIAKCTNCLFADFANANHNLKFVMDGETPSFTAIRVGDLARVDGKKIGPV